jgi:putative DNA base modification enzyme with NMAD domain
MTLFSYVVEHDTGHAPNPYFDVCTLCRCKYRNSPNKPRNIVELAKPGDWVVGTGGANPKKSAGHRKLVYAMRVAEKLCRGEYYADPRFKKKKPVRKGAFEQTRGDNTRTRGLFETHHQFVLISRRFYYFGRDAIVIPKNKFPKLEKTGPGFRRDFTPAEIDQFVKWLEKDRTTGKHGEPCQKDADHSVPRGNDRCKSSC